MKKNNILEHKLCGRIYESKCHIVNAMTHDFFYLEFSQENIEEDYLEMILSLKKHHDKHYICESGRVFMEIYEDIKPRVSSEEDIKLMFLKIDEILEYLKNAVALSFPHRGEKELYPNQDVQGYYLNHQYQGDEFPNELLEKIHSADRYVTLINDYSELLFIMKNGNETSLFYTLDTQ